MYIKEKDTFVFQPGAVMCNLFLADEINRTSAKTQSAFLEVMEEGTVTVDGVTRQVLDPFVVIATETAPVFPCGSVRPKSLPSPSVSTSSASFARSRKTKAGIHRAHPTSHQVRSVFLL